MAGKKSTRDMLKIALEKGDLGKKAVTGAFIALGYSNLAIGAVERRWKSYLDLKKRYGSYAEEIADFKLGEEASDDVWVCWLQGLEQAPELVKVCVESMREVLGCDRVHVVAKDDIDDVVELPGYVMDKWNDGRITNTHFSDILRNQLIIEHGGIWLDSTVYLTGELPSYINDSPLFLYKHMNLDDLSICYNSWFIKANKGDGTIASLQKLLIRYWMDNDRISDYFLWHLCLTLLLEGNGGRIEGLLPVSDYVPESLALMLGQPFDAKQWRHLQELSPVHKLTNKFDSAIVDQPGTYYSALVGGMVS